MHSGRILANFSEFLPLGDPGQVEKKQAFYKCCEFSTNPSDGWEWIWVFPKIGVPQKGWFMMENPIKMDDLGGKPPFSETPI